MKKLLSILILFSTLSFAQINGVTWVTMTIDSGGTASSTLDIIGDNLKIVGVVLDSTNWTSANFTMQEYNSTLGAWADVEDAGDAYTITIGAVTNHISTILAPADMAGFEKIRFVSSAAQDVGDITFYVKLRPY